MVAPLPAAETGDCAAAPPQCKPPPAGRLYIQPACAVDSPLSSRLHQALHCFPGPSGRYRQSCGAALDSSAGRDPGPVEGGGKL